ncbi:MAG: CRISPR-associated helicase/endonuclease Cas3, partial [Candidatus Omnitrophota bacterium]
RIKEIKEKKRGRKIIVSTQLIEAGVDISVDMAYRDFAPLDSINQIAGRCNRNFGDNKGEVKVFLLKQENNGKIYYPHTIYGSFIIDKSKSIFRNRIAEVNESEFLWLANEYFKKINDGKSDDLSQNILEVVEGLKFDDVSQFKLIEQKDYNIDVFVEIDGEAENLWEKYQLLIGNDEIYYLERKKEFLIIKKQFYNHVISVPIQFKYGLSNFDERAELGYISKGDLNQWYSIETGFCKDKNKSGIIMV